MGDSAANRDGSTEWVYELSRPRRVCRTASTALLELLELPYQRLPSYSTLRKVVERVPDESLTRVFNAWAITTLDLQPGEQVAGDGKGIKASVVAYDSHLQDFVNMVSAFSVRAGIVVGLVPMHTKRKAKSKPCCNY
jgi:hypothetical protein